MIRDFLLDHDVRVAIRGNPQATRMTWSQTSDNIRIVVPPADLEKAREALAAMSAGDAHPFRGPAPVAEDEHEEKFEKPRSGLGAAMLACFVPIGAGHFYARHGAAGTILAIGMIGAVLGSIAFGHLELFRAWMILVVLDAAGAFLAVRRFNQKRVPSEPCSVSGRWEPWSPRTASPGSSPVRAEPAPLRPGSSAGVRGGCGGPLSTLPRPW